MLIARLQLDQNRPKLGERPFMMSAMQLALDSEWAARGEGGGASASHTTNTG